MYDYGEILINYISILFRGFAASGEEYSGFAFENDKSEFSRYIFFILPVYKKINLLSQEVSQRLYSVKFAGLTICRARGEVCVCVKISRNFFYNCIFFRRN